MQAASVTLFATLPASIARPPAAGEAEGAAAPADGEAAASFAAALDALASAITGLTGDAGETDPAFTADVPLADVTSPLPVPSRAPLPEPVQPDLFAGWTVPSSAVSPAGRESIEGATKRNGEDGAEPAAPSTTDPTAAAGTDIPLTTDVAVAMPAPVDSTPGVANGAPSREHRTTNTPPDQAGATSAELRRPRPERPVVEPATGSPATPVGPPSNVFADRGDQPQGTDAAAPRMSDTAIQKSETPFDTPSTAADSTKAARPRPPDAVTTSGSVPTDGPVSANGEAAEHAATPLPEPRGRDLSSRGRGDGAPNRDGLARSETTFTTTKTVTTGESTEGPAEITVTSEAAGAREVFAPSRANAQQPAAASIDVQPHAAPSADRPAAGIDVPHAAPRLMTTTVAPTVTMPAGVLLRGGEETGATALPGSTSSQIVQSLRLLLSRNGGEAHIKLEPRQFGDMSVSLRVENRQVVARLEADAPVVREWLHSNQALLRGGLAEHHLTLDRIEVSEPAEPRESNARGREQQQQPDRRQSRPRAPRPDGGEPFEVIA